MSRYTIRSHGGFHWIVRGNVRLMGDTFRPRLEAITDILETEIDLYERERFHVSPEDDTEEIPDTFECDFCGDILETDQRRDMTDTRGNVVAWLCPRCMDNIPD